MSDSDFFQDVFENELRRGGDLRDCKVVVTEILVVECRQHIIELGIC